MANKAVLCEDEEQIRNYICKKLESAFRSRGLDYAFTTYERGDALAEALGKGETYDLYFLDIEMPGIDGLSLAKKIRSTAPEALIVFISNKEELVFQSFEVRPFRFLRKNHFEEELPGFLADLKKELGKHKKRSVLFENGGEMISIPVADILYVEAMRKECIIHTTTGEISIKYKLSDVSAELIPHGFVQSHRSFLINCRYIYSISRDGIALDNSETIPVGRTHLEQVKLEFQQFIQEF